MTDIVSLRLAIFSATAQLCDLVRQGAGLATIPVDVMEAENVAAAQKGLAARAVDLLLVDDALGVDARTAVIRAARALPKPPAVLLLTPTGANPRDMTGAAPDGIAAAPASVKDAKALIDRCSRLRVPSRVLVVDDSPTMRSIIRRILGASRFPMEITDVEEGIAALGQIASGRFEFVMLDYNMPGLNGVETLHEIKRQYPKVEVVIITATPDEAIAERARAAGAAAFLKKPFYPTDIDTVLFRMCGVRALPPSPPG